MAIDRFVRYGSGGWFAKMDNGTNCYVAKNSIARGILEEIYRNSKKENSIISIETYNRYSKLKLINK